MDLKAAMEKAKELSIKEKRKKYVLVDNDGECSITNAPLKGVVFAAKDGQEVPLAGSEKALELGVQPDEKVAKKKAPPVTNTGNNTSTPKPTNRTTAKPARKIVEKEKQKEMETVTRKPVSKTKKSNGKTVEKIVRGNNMTLTKSEWNKVDAILKKDGISFSEFSRNLVLSKIK